MSAWSKVKLGQVAEFINGDRGKNYPSEDDFVDQGIPFINAGHLTDGKVVFSNMNYISESRFHLLGSGKTRMNDILYCLRGSLGKTAIVRHKDDAAIASSLVIIRPSNDCSVDYLYHFLTSPTAKSELHKFDNGSSQPNLSASSVKNYVLPLPPLAEQRRIADVLDRAEALRAKRRVALTQLDTLTQSVFLDLFGDPNTNPKGWPLSTIGAVSEQVTDGEHLTPKRTTTGIKLLSARNIRDGYLDFQDVDYVGPEEYERIKSRCNPSLGDVLISCSGTIGRVALVETNESLSLVRSVALVRPKRSLVGSKFLEHYLRTTTLKERMLRRANASSQANLFQGQIRELPVYLPPVSLQQDLARRVESVGRLRATFRASLAELDALFAVLQHRAFRGEV